MMHARRIVKNSKHNLYASVLAGCSPKTAHGTAAYLLGCPDARSNPVGAIDRRGNNLPATA